MALLTMPEDSNITYLDNPRNGILVSASTGNSNLLQHIIDHYYREYSSYLPQQKRTKMSALCPEKAIVLAARQGHSKIVEMILLDLNYLLLGDALLQAAKEGHQSVILTIMNRFRHGGWPYDPSYSEEVQRSQSQILEKFRRDGWDSNSDTWRRILHKSQQIYRKEQERKLLLKKVQKRPRGPLSKNEKRLLSNRYFMLGMGSR
jgi:hypothetical protein